MQAAKRYSFWQILMWEWKYLLIFLIIDTIPVVLYKFLGITWIIVPWQPLSVIGIAVAFYLGFKNNSAYERLWEGRKVWGGINNTSRVFTFMFRDFITNEFAKAKLAESELTKIRKRILNRHIAWLHALTISMRKKMAWEHYSKQDNKFRKSVGLIYDENDYKQINKYLSDSDRSYLSKKDNIATHILSLQSMEFKDLKLKGLIDDFRHIELANLLKELMVLQGRAEGMKNWPFPRQFASANYYFVWTFILLLPFSMIGIFISSGSDLLIWASIPFSMLVSIIFFTMELIGDYSENPFEGLYNDVPVTSMNRNMEIDILQMMEESEVPERITPEEKFNVLY
jgi:putative membrane protein